VLGYLVLKGDLFAVKGGPNPGPRQQETVGLDWFGPPRSNTLCPVSSCRVPELGVLVVGVTSWSGEGVGPKSLEVVFDL
jgi:hypothetical protein